MKVLLVFVTGALLLPPALVASCVGAELLARRMGAEVSGGQIGVAAIGGLFAALGTIAVVFVKGGRP